MFRRREKPLIHHRMRAWVWPRGGIMRAWRYVMHRLARLPGSAYSIAAGFACGAAISFTPFVGFHILISALLAWALRANILASAIGTVVGNPWTFPFIWVWLYESGTWMITRDSASGPMPNFEQTFSQIMEALLRFDLSSLIDSAMPVFWPMFLSGVPTALVVWFVFFLPLQRLINAYQKRRAHRLHMRAVEWQKTLERNLRGEG